MKRLPNINELQNTRFDTLTDSETLSSLASSKSGLSGQEAEQRLGVYGHNKLPEKKKDGFIKKILLQFNNALIYVLLAAAVLTSVMQHWVDTGVILGVVIINAIVGYLQESKAEKALESIKNLLSLKALVRAGHGSTKVTKDIYWELFRQDSKNAARAIDGLFGNN